MTRPGLPARDRRALVIGAATVLLLVLGGKGVPAWLRWTGGARAEASALIAEAVRARESVRNTGTVRDSLAARRPRYEELAPAILEGETATGAAGSLAEQLSNAAAEANVQLGSVQLRADTTSQAAFTRVAVRADFTGDIIGVAAMLYVLEGGAELLSIRELSITQPEPAAGDDRPEMLRVSLVIEGLVRREAGGAR